MCRTLEVSRSGFYSWKNRKLSKRKSFNILLLSEIRRIYENSGEIYESPKIHKSLLSKGYLCSKKLVERLMKIAKIRSKIVKKYSVSSTNSNHKLSLSPNRLNRNFYASKPGMIAILDRRGHFEQFSVCKPGITGISVRRGHPEQSSSVRP